MRLRVAPGPLGVVARVLGGPAPYDRGARDRLAELTDRCLAAAEVSPDDVALAWELSQRVSEVEARPLGFALVTLTLDAARRGSTRLVIDGREDELRARAVALGLDPEVLVPIVGPSIVGGAAPPTPPRMGTGQLALPFDAPGPRHLRPPRALGGLLSAEEGATPLVWREGGVALAHFLWVERRIAEGLGQRAVPPTDPAEAAARVASLRAEPLVGPRGPVELTDEQEEAVAAVLSERTVVLTGGPGTGKTSIVVAMLRALARREGPQLASEVALAAPTGKAADRLGESVRTALGASPHAADAALAAAVRPPSTLHRLLGYRPRDGSFRAHEGNRLTQRVVIVDEASMIDAALFARLLAAVSPEATLVLLGDPDQLPSVDPGAVLRDLVRTPSKGVRVVALTQSHRMDPRDPDGAHVLSTARACLGEGPRAVQAFRRSEPSEPAVGRGGAWRVEPDRLGVELDAWIARHVLVEEVLAPLSSVDPSGAGADAAPPAVARALERAARARLLTVLRRTAEELDAYVGDAVARWYRAGGERNRGAILPGEPVLVVRNDYDEDLWNGDSGIVWRTSTGELRVSFRRGNGAVTRPLAAVAHLVERAHATTVHKAQGSEHDEVMLVLPPLDGPLLSQEIVYTAITRARRAAVVVGRRELLESALGRRGERDTHLGSLLATRS
ncbi:MAG: hypothetical protein OHK0013_30230 [Sandaracinaceae bacterium]